MHGAQVTLLSSILCAIRGGAFAEYMIAGEDEIAIKPLTLTFVDAAALPLAAGAAYTALFKMNSIFSGQRVVILGDGGLVGLFALQMAKEAGAYSDWVDCQWRGDRG